MTDGSLPITIHPLTPRKSVAGRKNIFAYLFFAFIKIFLSVFDLFWACWTVPWPTHFVVQNPPSIPTLAVVWAVSRLRGSKFVIDWHNYGYSIVALSQSSKTLVSIAKRYERFFGRLADHHFCVTHAMQSDLKRNWAISAPITVVHDRPFESFRQTTEQEKIRLFSKLSLQPLNDVSEHKLFQQQSSQWFKNAATAPAILISSTSWTADEDFSILLDAVRECDTRAAATAGFPNVLVVVTGKGPQKAEYEKRMKSIKLRTFALATVWLEASDYPIMLGSANLGVCLHTSSSGLDLPMKVVDMFGCGVPVCAVDFACIGELVQSGVNGLLFTTASQLSDQIFSLFHDFHSDRKSLKSLASGVNRTQKVNWQTNWTAHVAPLFARPKK
eukprot:c7912_g1_i1.p1 GENE.c7912_g1_i1~~c7912_g1_i1.p1  ORF type:complete len:442 (-),score=87.96 c7912_g1_i1:83-1240(-)